MVPRLHSQLLHMVPAFFSPFPFQARGCHLLLESPLLVWAAVHEDDRSLGMEGRSTCCFGRWETSPLLPGVQAEMLRTPTIEPTCRLFPPTIQVLPVVVPPSSATLVLCRWDQQRTADYLRPFPAPAETAQGRCKERSMCRGNHAHLQALLLPGRYRASVVGTVTAQLRFLLYTLLLDMKHDATDRFMNRHPHRCLYTARKEDELVF